MKERGMIFNGEMVRAILDGRKTQTRRIMAPQPADDIERCIFPNPEAIGWKSSLRHKHGSTTAHFCHYGKPGDRIWVRETFQGPLFDYDLMDSYCKDPTPFEKPEFCVYKADGVPAPEFYDADDELHCCWRPSIHMPRWASRILLEITNVRVERLKSISDGDAIREGCSTADMKSGDCVADVFARLWASIYGAESWNANPWVWVIEFKRVEGGES
ncbi:morphogenetic protein [Klebsiella pneumoniae]